MKRIIAKKD